MADQKWRMAEQNGMCLDKLSTHFLYLISSSVKIKYALLYIYAIVGRCILRNTLPETEVRGSLHSMHEIVGDLVRD